MSHVLLSHVNFRKQHQQSQQDAPGFALLEATLALLCMGIVMGVAIAAWGGMCRVIDRTHARREALHIACNVMEQALATPHTSNYVKVIDNFTVTVMARPNLACMRYYGIEVSVASSSGVVNLHSGACV